MADLTPKEKLLLKFMEMTIEKVNTCLMNIHALQAMLIAKGAFTVSELSAYVKDARELPETKIGKRVLEEMARDFDVAKLTDMLNLRETGKVDGLPRSAGSGVLSSGEGA